MRRISGLDPLELERRIQSQNFPKKGNSLKAVVTDTSNLIARNSIIVQHPSWYCTSAYTTDDLIHCC